MDHNPYFKRTKGIFSSPRNNRYFNKNSAHIIQNWKKTLSKLKYITNKQIYSFLRLKKPIKPQEYSSIHSQSTRIRNDLRFLPKILSTQILEIQNYKSIHYKPKVEWLCISPLHDMLNESRFKIWKYLRIYNGIRSFEWKTSKPSCMFKEFNYEILKYLQNCPNLNILRLIDLPQDCLWMDEIIYNSILDLRLLYNKLEYLDWSGFTSDSTLTNKILQNLGYLINLKELKVAIYIDKDCYSFYGYEDLFNDCNYENLTKLKKFCLEFHNDWLDNQGIYNLKTFVAKIPNLEDFYFRSYSREGEVDEIDIRLLPNLIKDLEEFPRSSLKGLLLSMAVVNLQEEEKILEIPWYELSFLEELSINMDIRESTHTLSPLIFTRGLKNLASLKTLKLRLKLPYEHKDISESIPDIMNTYSSQRSKLDDDNEGSNLNEIENIGSNEDNQEDIDLSIKMKNEDVDESEEKKNEEFLGLNQEFSTVNEEVLPVNKEALPVNEEALPVNEEALPVNEELLQPNKEKTLFELFHMISSLVNLSSIHLDFINIDLDETEFSSMGNILNNLTKLTHLKLIFANFKMSKKGTELFFSALASLKHIKNLYMNFYACSELTNHLISLFQKFFGQLNANLMYILEEFTLDLGITFIRGDEILTLGDVFKNFSKMKSLILNIYSTNMTFEQRMEFSKKLSRLKNLKLVKCGFDSYFSLEQRKNFELKAIDHFKVMWENQSFQYDEQLWFVKM